MSHARRRGFTTLALTLILLSILAAVSAFIGKVLIADKRLTLNEIEYRVAMAAAEKGISEAMAELRVNPATTAISGGIASASASGSYQVTITPNGVANVTDMVSVATLATGTVATVSVQVAARGILNPAHSGPAAPLLVAGTFPANGTITVVANPNGGGPGIPVSIWSAGKVDIGGNATTCGLDEYHHGGCNKDNAYSYKAGGETLIGPDIVANAADFPGDLVDYVFGEPDSAAGWARIEARATAIVNSCSDPRITGGAGVFIVEKVQHCTIGSIGTQAAPVVLIIKDSQLTINANSQVYGLVFAYDSDPSGGDEYKITINGGAKLFGMMLVNHNNIDLPNGNYAAIYDPKVLCHINDCDEGGPGAGGSPFVALGYVPGSWKDWE
ncbi:hypothetical protein [Zobellella iuensis]|uniref:Type 4 fimbrial biogenesis protein PilX N-terminal domain-containing protein n=1 Tax=Zobellella iuensis TaxID=2803811 RepID=A0ABS1QQQ6_9GAMM|nr:hypothetical protein [Zobellella iuensis]MBL1376847.1 hypothetical protein [Zobellella iuensis]